MLPQIASSSRRPLGSLCRLCRSHRSLLPAFSSTTPRRSASYLRQGSPSDRPGFPSHPRPSVRPPKPPKTPLRPEAFLAPPPPKANYIVRLLSNRLPEFIRSDRFRGKLDDYGIGPQTQTLLVKQWESEVQQSLESVEDEESAIRALEEGGWNLDNLSRSFTGEGSGFAGAAEATFHRRFVEFASTHESIGPALQSHLRAILDATDLTRIAFKGEMVRARAMTRHFHLHIGPTNSGKTYNALKSLAKAETGAYAGPLRLLAHEVWERLNLGTVGGLDGEKKECNLLTGEERRIVNADAGLMSCTVEMIPLNGPPGGYDVVVIDEIQMMGDPARGGAWTKAVLGVCAKEVHLCGDETAVDLLSTLIPQLGDKLTIHRYERLTPLEVADKSLEGDWNKVEPGDCIVTFSRNNIYAIKKQIESVAAKKCAVVYGALPPETRADQARDFNDEKGMCQVLVASDAVGMGLNLKINRIIFESLEKYNGKTEVPLSLTQVKQIAGRAGRFGMQRTAKAVGGDENDPSEPDEVPKAGGSVTTLHKVDLPILKAVLPLELPKMARATMDVPFRTLSDLSMLLPPNTPHADVLDHLQHLVKLPPSTQSGNFDGVVPVAEILEPFRNFLSLTEIDTFTSCPISHRDPHIVNIYTNIVRTYSKEGLVEIDRVFQDTKFLSLLDLVEGTLATLPPLPPIIGIGRGLLTPPVIVSSIPQMESMHKALVMYIWLSFRLEVAFPERSRAVELKTRVEVVLDECLARFPGLRNLKSHERTKQGDRAVADWRKQYVSPNGTRKMPGVQGKGIQWVEEAVVQRLRNKQIWASTGVVPFGRVLKESDGKGPLGIVEAEYMPGLEAPGRSNKLLEGPRDRQAEIESAKAREELYVLAGPEEDPQDQDETYDRKEVPRKKRGYMRGGYQLPDARKPVEHGGYDLDGTDTDLLDPPSSRRQGYGGYDRGGGTSASESRNRPYGGGGRSEGRGYGGGGGRNKGGFGLRD